LREKIVLNDHGVTLARGDEKPEVLKSSLTMLSRSPVVSDDSGRKWPLFTKTYVILPAIREKSILPKQTTIEQSLAYCKLGDRYNASNILFKLMSSPMHPKFHAGNCEL